MTQDNKKLEDATIIEIKSAIYDEGVKMRISQEKINAYEAELVKRYQQAQQPVQPTKPIEVPETKETKKAK